MMRVACLALILAIGCSCGAAAQTVSAPKPAYPYECRAAGIGGSGVVLVIVDTKTGKARGARMLKSTGNRLLDGAALEAFSRFRFKPGSTSSEVEVPVTFDMPKKKR